MCTRLTIFGACEVRRMSRPDLRPLITEKLEKMLMAAVVDKHFWHIFNAIWYIIAVNWAQIKA